MLKIYHILDEISDQYEVTLNKRPAQLSAATVSAVPYSTQWPGRQRPLNQTERASFLRFEADERVEVCVRMRQARKSAVVRPLSSGVKVKLEGEEARFQLTRPGNYTFESDGTHGALHIFFAPLYGQDAQTDNPNTLYFGPGIHRPGEIRLKSNQTLYLSPEATVYGSVVAVNAENVRVCGYGILDGSNEKRSAGGALLPVDDAEPFDLSDASGFLARRALQGCAAGGVQLYGCQKVEITGITLRDAVSPALVFAACTRVRVEGVKSVGMWRYGSGGAQIINSSDVRMDTCFIRAFDDCVAVKGVRGFDARPCERVQIRRAITWCDWGRDLLVGCETHADEIHTVLFEDCDLLHGAHARMGILNQNRADAHHVEFRNIRAEFSKDHQTPMYQTDVKTPYTAPRACEMPAVADIAVYEASYFGDEGENGAIHDVVLKDIHLRMDEGQSAPEFRVQGLSGVHDVRNVYIDGFYVNGMRVRAYAKANIFVNAFASKVVFS